MAEETFYKVRRRSDNLFSNGGGTPRFSARGKIWRNLGPLRNHINQLSNPRIYDDCEIIKFETKEIESIPASQEVTASARRKQEKANAIRLASEERQRTEDIARLKDLQAKYGNVV